MTHTGKLSRYPGRGHWFESHRPRHSFLELPAWHRGLRSTAHTAIQPAV